MCVCVWEGYSIMNLVLLKVFFSCELFYAFAWNTVRILLSETLYKLYEIWFLLQTAQIKTEQMLNLV